MRTSLLKSVLVAVLVTGLLHAQAARAQAQGQGFPLPPAEWEDPVADTPVIPFLLVDRLEYSWQKGNDARVWDVQGWIGGDKHKFWFKSEGADPVGKPTEEANVEALYARFISPFWYLQAGVRHEFKPSPSRNTAVIGIQGLAPYWFDVEASAYLAEGGDVSARFEAEYDILFTQRLILQPRIETGLAASRDRERGIGRGFNDVTLGLRLRYEIKREFAPYIGVTWTRTLGETADFARREGEDINEFAVVAGVRIWY